MEGVYVCELLWVSGGLTAHSGIDWGVRCFRGSYAGKDTINIGALCNAGYVMREV